MAAEDSDGRGSDEYEIQRVRTAQTFYQKLGISNDASEGDIRKAYHRLARRLHPDKNKAAYAEEAFKTVADAHEVLKDPRMRQRYDRALANGEEWRDQKDFDFGSAAEDAGTGISVAAAWAERSSLWGFAQFVGIRATLVVYLLCVYTHAIAMLLKTLIYEGLSSGQRSLLVILMYGLYYFLAINHKSFAIQISVMAFACFVGLTLFMNGKLMSALCVLLSGGIYVCGYGVTMSVFGGSFVWLVVGACGFSYARSRGKQSDMGSDTGGSSEHQYKPSAPSDRPDPSPDHAGPKQSRRSQSAAKPPPARGGGSAKKRGKKERKEKVARA